MEQQLAMPTAGRHLAEGVVSDGGGGDNAQRQGVARDGGEREKMMNNIIIEH